MYSTVHFPNRPRNVKKSNSYLNLPFNRKFTTTLSHIYKHIDSHKNCSLGSSNPFSPF